MINQTTTLVPKTNIHHTKNHYPILMPITQSANVPIKSYDTPQDIASVILQTHKKLHPKTLKYPIPNPQTPFFLTKISTNIKRWKNGIFENLITILRRYCIPKISH